MRISRYLLLAAAFVAFSCVEEIVLDPMEEMPVVVSCILTRDETTGLSVKTQYVDLFWARRPSETDYKKISEATVRVVSGDEVHEFVWNGERWECDFNPVAGAEYQLMVSTPDGKTLSASARFPDDIFLSGVHSDIAFYAPPDLDGERTNIYVAYYLSRNPFVAGGNTPYEKEAFAWITAAGDLEGQVGITTDHEGVDGFNVSSGVWHDLAITDKWKEFLVDSPDVADVEKARKWWQEYSRYCFSHPVHNGFVRIHQQEGFRGSFPADLTDATHKAALFTLCADFPSLYRNYYKVRFLSQEYDAYLRAIAKNGIHDDELTSFYSLDEVPSNIQGGLGVFGAQRIIFVKTTPPL